MNRNLTIRLADGRISLRVHARTLIVLAVVLVLLALALAATLAFGEIRFSLADVARAVQGQGGEFAQLIVRGFRGPRALEGALVGAMLGLSGALFQRLAQNALVAPDIIGVNQGAAVAVMVTVLLTTNQNIIPFTAFAGGITAAGIGFLLSMRRGLSPYRLVLVGIAINSILNVVMHFLVTYAYNNPNATPLGARGWLSGNLESSTYTQATFLAVAFALLAPAALLVGRGLDLLALGQDRARSLALRIDRTRAAAVLVGVLLAAMTVSVVGSIGFVAFISPHIARRIARNYASGSLLLAAAVGALVLVTADYVARRIIEPNQLPVGIITVALGAPYFLLLLYRGGRQGHIV